MWKISLEELVCLENVVNTHSTYFIIDLKLSKLFQEILKDGKRGVIPILETRVLLRTLLDIPFLEDNEGTLILKDLTNCMENHWYSLRNTWNCKTIVKGIAKLRKLISYDYLIYGSLVIHNDDHIKWDLSVSITPNV